MTDFSLDKSIKFGEVEIRPKFGLAACDQFCKSLPVSEICSGLSANENCGNELFCGAGDLTKFRDRPIGIN